ncbi:MAG: S-methyl-5-thioribose-1-phosphate isomerase [Candidatus Thermoplasmatota archaeon]|jgi:translation initiation factor eIF-2B subunit alpha/methylthioribose-1-phosphate isomerase|nr:S-methyl-5-thioribose-1-phosphate isomerase [Candidatus Thermoplasmatota archaeon]
MKINGKDYQSLWREEETIHFIDQRKLPHTFEIYSARTIDDIAYAIKEMVVRGAPAIGAAAAYGMAIGNKNPERTATVLRTTRPTAYDLFHAIEYMTNAIQQGKNAFTAATLYAQTIISRCKKIGEHGEKLIKDSTRILTHCNAGALATIDYGTALAPIRLAHENKKELFVYADETRPRLQGVLTAWELYHEGIPHVLIADNAAGYYMRKKDIDLVIVGADRIAKNGDFANKIGTYEKAVLAKENGIPFYVAAPASTFDPHLKDGSQIIIEERAKQEMTQIAGITIMPEWISVKNPAFDVTPQKYVSGYITEDGILKK